MKTPTKHICIIPIISALTGFACAGQIEKQRLVAYKEYANPTRYKDINYYGSTLDHNTGIYWLAYGDNYLLGNCVKMDIGKAIDAYYMAISKLYCGLDGVFSYPEDIDSGSVMGMLSSIMADCVCKSYKPQVARCRAFNSLASALLLNPKVTSKMRRSTWIEKSIKETGTNGVYKAAVKYYEEAAGMGSGYAMSRLAECYREGIGVDKNEAKAAEFEKMAADKHYCDDRKAFEKCDDILTVAELSELYDLIMSEDSNKDARYRESYSGKPYVFWGQCEILGERKDGNGLWNQSVYIPVGKIKTGERVVESGMEWTGGLYTIRFDDDSFEPYTYLWKLKSKDEKDMKLMSVNVSYSDDDVVSGMRRLEREEIMMGDVDTQWVYVSGYMPKECPSSVNFDIGRTVVGFQRIHRGSIQEQP